jgi:hypothetical protein
MKPSERRPPCPGCGHYYAVHHAHRPDCTLTPDERKRFDPVAIK